MLLNNEYTRTLLFSSVVDLMGLVVNRIHPAVNTAFHARARPSAWRSSRSTTNSTTSNQSSCRVGRHHCRTDGDDRHDDGRRPAPAASGLPSQDSRRQPSRRHRASHQGVEHNSPTGALPGQALVVLDPSLMLMTDVILCEDGHAQGVRSRQCQGFPRNPGRFHPGSGLSPSLDQLGAIEREASFLVK